jgi:hypothetical protein
MSPLASWSWCVETNFIADPGWVNKIMESPSPQGAGSAVHIGYATSACMGQV